MVQTIRESSVLPDEWRNLKAVKCFLVLPSPANQKLCTMIPKSDTLKQALRHQTVLEYPDVLLSALDSPAGWEVVDNRKIVVLEDGQGEGEAEGADAPSQPSAGNSEAKPSRKRNRGKRKAADMTAASGASEGVVEEQQEREKQPALGGKDSEPTGAPSSVSTQNESIQEVPMASATTTTVPDEGEPSTEPVSKKVRTE